MRRRAAALAVALILVGCADGAPEPTPSGTPPPGTGPNDAGPDCAPDLPPRTSPDGIPTAVLHVGGEDLPPVRGDVRFDGPAGEVTHDAPARLHVERFIVLQPRGREVASIRMTDGVALDAWTVWAVPNRTFRRGELETDRDLWLEGAVPGTTILCVPLREGEWLVAAELTFADGVGEGTYYWRLNPSDVDQAAS